MAFICEKYDDTGVMWHDALESMYQVLLLAVVSAKDWESMQKRSCAWNLPEKDFSTTIFSMTPHVTVFELKVQTGATSVQMD